MAEFVCSTALETGFSGWPHFSTSSRKHEAGFNERVDQEVRCNTRRHTPTSGDVDEPKSDTEEAGNNSGASRCAKASGQQSPDTVCQAEGKSRCQDLHEQTNTLVAQVVHQPLAKYDFFEDPRCNRHRQTEDFQDRRTDEICAHAGQARALPDERPG